MFKNLIDIKSLNKDEILQITDLAADFEKGAAASTCQDKHLALLFCENSTRTRFSFEMAANKLGIHLYDFDADKSSFSKGESLKDTIENLSAIGINGIVIRHSETGFVERAVDEISCAMIFINAGDGKHAHPTQALLDFYTMKKHLKFVEGRKIAIIGDIKHSRVARSNVALLKKFGAEVVLCAPDYFRAYDLDTTYVDRLEDALADADVAMFLRVQNERLEEKISVSKYVKNYGLTMEKVQNYVKPNALIMHPGPVNRDVEISSDILDSEWGKIILEQAHNGVFVRMAVLELLLGGQNDY